MYIHVCTCKREKVYIAMHKKNHIYREVQKKAYICTSVSVHVMYMYYVSTKTLIFFRFADVGLKEPCKVDRAEYESLHAR